MKFGRTSTGTEGNFLTLIAVEPERKGISEIWSQWYRNKREFLKFDLVADQIGISEVIFIMELDGFSII